MKSQYVIKIFLIVLLMFAENYLIKRAKQRGCEIGTLNLVSFMSQREPTKQTIDDATRLCKDLIP